MCSLFVTIFLWTRIYRILYYVFGSTVGAVLKRRVLGLLFTPLLFAQNYFCHRATPHTATHCVQIAD